ncbi:MAG: cytochrome c family protein, partial [Planctomycetaceae bacterium]
MLKKAHWRREILALFWIAAAIVLGSVAAAATSSSPTQAIAAAAPSDPAQVLGNETCVRCHAAEQQVWAATPHARTFDELHRRPEAAQIAKRLGVASIKHSGRCVACHYTQQRDPHASGTAAESLSTTFTSATPIASSGHADDAVHAIAGVSCESCHGPARQWLEAHHDYGDATTTRLTESPAHRSERIARSVALGMRNPSNVYLVAQSCYRCHTTGDEELVNVGQHSAGSADFEFVSWSQGTLLHNFVGSDGKLNQPSSPHRLRYMFVAGVIADTEASLRAVATATVKDRYAIAVAKRAARAGARLRSVAEKMDDPRFDQASDVFAAIQIKLNNAAELQAAADELAEIGYLIAATESDAKETALHQ